MARSAAACSLTELKAAMARAPEGQCEMITRERCHNRQQNNSINSPADVVLSTSPAEAGCCDRSSFFLACDHGQGGTNTEKRGTHLCLVQLRSLLLKLVLDARNLGLSELGLRLKAGHCVLVALCLVDGKLRME